MPIMSEITGKPKQIKKESWAETMLTIFWEAWGAVVFWSTLSIFLLWWLGFMVCIFIILALIFILICMRAIFARSLERDDDVEIERDDWQ